MTSPLLNPTYHQRSDSLPWCCQVRLAVSEVH